MKTHPNALYRRSRREYLTFIFRFLQKSVFHTVIWPSAVISQDMADIAKNRKRRRLNSIDTPGGLNNPKSMYFPPSNFISSDIETTLATNTNANVHATEPNRDEPEYMLEEYLEESSDGDVLDRDLRASDYAPQNSQFIEDVMDPLVEHPQHNAVCCSKCREDRERFQNMMLRKINEILETVRGNAAPLGHRRSNYELLPPMPFTDVESLLKFDSELKQNERMQAQFIQKIQGMGGKNVQKAIKYALETIMTDGLSQKVVWTLGAAHFPKISKLVFPYIIIDVVRDTFPTTTIKFAEDRIADWLRRGGDRLKAAATAANKRNRLNNREPE